MFVPLGLEDTALSRVPWVSISIVVVAVAAFVKLASAPDLHQQRVLEAAHFWVEHPYLAIPEALEGRLPVQIRQREAFHCRCRRRKFLGQDNCADKT